MKLISHRYIYARTIEHKKYYKRGLKLTINPNYLNKYLKKKERKEKEQERGTKVSTVSKTLYTSIHGQKMEKKKKKKIRGSQQAVSHFTVRLGPSHGLFEIGHDLNGTPI